MNVKIYLFEKDEIDIIDQWIHYYQNLFGTENIVIIDHCSTDGTWDLVKTYRTDGLILERFNGPYKNKGKALSFIMKKYPADVMIPLDADEFLVTHHEDILTKDKVKILADLQSITDLKENSHAHVGRFTFSRIYNHINTVIEPKLEDMKHFVLKDYRKIDGLTKCFFRSNGFISTDTGNHWGSISSDFSTKKTKNLTLLHFPIRGLPHFKSKTDKSCQAFQYDKLKKGSTASMGKHWKNDYDLMISGGAELAFKNKYLKNIDEVKDVFQFEFFPI